MGRVSLRSIILSSPRKERNRWDYADVYRFVKGEHPASPSFAEATEGYAVTSPASLSCFAILLRRVTDLPAGQAGAP